MCIRDRVQGTDIGDCIQRYVDMAAWVQPLLLLNILLLALLANVLRRVRPWIGQVVVILIAAASSAQLFGVWSMIAIDGGGWQRLLRAALLGGLVAATMLSYFVLRARSFSHALAEARLQAMLSLIHI